MQQTNARRVMALALTGKKARGLGADILTDAYNPGLEPAETLPTISPVYQVQDVYNLTTGAPTGAVAAVSTLPAAPFGLSWPVLGLLAVGGYMLFFSESPRRRRR